ncbi:MAG: hypothetical protein QOK41_580 [Sphingomonadales bacterium]|jgi:hypothetical protein|nr:hypothetical protein [Sphingomonadales bacterium]
MRISTMEMFLGRGLAAFVTGGGQSFATEITIDDSPGRDYVITVDPAGRRVSFSLYQGDLARGQIVDRANDA